MIIMILMITNMIAMLILTIMMMQSAEQAVRLVCDQVSAAAASGNMIKQHLLQTVTDRDDDIDHRDNDDDRDNDIDDRDNGDDRDGCERH